MRQCADANAFLGMQEAENYAIGERKILYLSTRNLTKKTCLSPDG